MSEVDQVQNDLQNMDLDDKSEDSNRSEGYHCDWCGKCCSTLIPSCFCAAGHEICNCCYDKYIIKDLERFILGISPNTIISIEECYGCKKDELRREEERLLKIKTEYIQILKNDLGVESNPKLERLLYLIENKSECLTEKETVFMTFISKK